MTVNKNQDLLTALSIEDTKGYATPLITRMAGELNCPGATRASLFNSVYQGKPTELKEKFLEQFKERVTSNFKLLEGENDSFMPGDKDTFYMKGSDFLFHVTITGDVETGTSCIHVHGICFLFKEVKVNGILVDLNNVEHKQVLDDEGYPLQHIKYIVLSEDNNGEIQAIDEEVTSNVLIKAKKELCPSIDLDQMFDLYYTTNENVMIYCGDSGTGKSSLATRTILEIGRRKYQDNSNKSTEGISYHDSTRVIYIKDEALLERDDVYAQISKYRPDFVLLDDMDQGLTPRFYEDMSEEYRRALENEGTIKDRIDESRNYNPTMNKLLSFTNGAIENNIKVIITTNRSVTKGSIDPALVRRGRCFDILNLPELSYTEALEIWTTVLKVDQTGFFELYGKSSEDVPSICQAELVAEAKIWTQVGNRSYLRNNSISIRKDLGGDRISRAKRTEYIEHAATETAMDSSHHTKDIFDPAGRPRKSFLN